MATFLLELFSEEIPSRMQRGAAEQLQRLIVGGFEKAGLKPEGVRSFVSPRHLALQLAGLPTIQPDVKEERKGPKIGAPEQAMKGFLTAVGLTAEQCEQRDGYYFATIEKKGQPVATVAKEIIESALSAFVWPKSMRWGSHAHAWVRPLHRIVALLDAEVIPAQFAHLTASNITEGHRFLAPAPITIAHAEQYAEALAAAKVMVDYAARRGAIESAVHTLAEAEGLKVNPDEALLDEVTGLVEWPVPLLCQFDAKFLDLPPEVLISEMKNHQRYFALLSADGKLSDKFITVANNITKDAGAKVKEGNARVVRARLADGEFYWEQDKKTKLEAWGSKLADVVFHAKVGMMDAKVQHIKTLSLAIAKEVGFADTAAISRTALLAKADLTSGMVGEFPELQGIMGRYYALAQGEKPEVADAIRDHYKPVGAGDDVAESQLAAIVGVADKLDSILSLFAAGEKPTGSKDPLALRRAALGILRTILRHQWNIRLETLISVQLYAINISRWVDGISAALTEASIVLTSEQYEVVTNEPFARTHDDSNMNRVIELAQKKVTHLDVKKVIIEVIDFFRDRLKQILKDEGQRHDVIEASLSVAGSGFNPLAAANNARALTAWLDSAAGKESFAAIKRALNILAAEEKKAKTTVAPAIAASFSQPAEQALAAALNALKAAAPADLNALAAPINQFFTDLLVTEEGHRDARLGLLAQVRASASTIADFSKLEG